jgi:hypothetical protein
VAAVVSTGIAILLRLAEVVSIVRDGLSRKAAQMQASFSLPRYLAMMKMPPTTGQINAKLPVMRVLQVGPVK